MVIDFFSTLGRNSEELKYKIRFDAFNKTSLHEGGNAVL